MNLTSKEKKTIVAGGVAAGLTLLIAYVIVPLMQEWGRLGDVLGPKLEYVQKLRERLRAQSALLARRDELSKKLGSVLGPEAYTPPKESEKPRSGKAGSKGPKGSEDSKQAANKDGPAKPESTHTAKAPEAKGEPGKPKPDQKKPNAKRPAKDEPKPEKAKKKDTAPTGISVATHLERLAKKSGVKLNKVTPRKPSRRCKGDKHIGPVGLTIGFEANIQSLIKLLHALEKGERLVRVEQAEFRRDLKKPQNIQVTLYVVGYELGAR